MKPTLTLDQRPEVMLVVGGGIGDQVCAEPTVRYAVEKLATLRISVIAPNPEFFSHIGAANVFKFGVDKHVDLSKYVVRGTYPDKLEDLGRVLCSVHTNGVDYCSMMALKWMLPFDRREIFLRGTRPSQSVEPAIFSSKIHWSDMVLIHAGTSWKSKTFPAKWWVELIEEIREEGLMPVLIGADIEDAPTGTLRLATNKCLDLRNKLSMAESIWLLQRAKVLITNDSAPLHIAASREPSDENEVGGAWIGMLSTAKHPDYLMHWRRGKLGYRMENLTCGGIWERPLVEDAKTATEQEILEWLPRPSMVAEWAMEKLCNP